MSDESPEARTARVLAAQAAWAPREVATDPVGILREWMALSPENRMSALGRRLADPALEATIECEAYGPRTVAQPGGVIEKFAAAAKAREAAARAQLEELNKHLPPTSQIY